MQDIIKIIRYSWNLKAYYLLTAAFVVVISLMNQATPFIIKFLVAAFDTKSRGGAVAPSYVVWLVVAFLVINVVLTLITNIQGYYGDILGTKLNTLLSQKYYDHILKLPMSYYDDEIAGRITSRLERSITTISQLMNAFANNFVGFFLTSAITLVILAFYAWPVAVLLGLLFPFYMYLTSLSSARWQKKQEPINVATDTNNGRFIESVNSMRVVKSFVQEVAESRFFARKRAFIENSTRGQSVEWHMFDIYRRLGLAVVFFLIYGYIAYQTYTGKFDTSTFVLLVTLVTQAQFPLFASSFIIDNIQRAQAGSRDFFSVMDTDPAIKDAADAQELTVKTGKVTFSDISFAYADGRPVLTGVSFTVEPGTKVALVGESGEGKTTITNLLLRFYKLDQGTILIDNQDITSVTQASLRRNIGVVFQEPTLFSGSVRENVSYGSPDATIQAVENAAKAANAHDFIMKLPDGYDSQIGERGVKLSGGQKQRIAIARAVLKNPPILILDEATSSLDSRSEHEVQAALSELMKGRTTLIIAHRLSTIAAVDTIIGIAGGVISEQGSPAELATSGGIYAELLALQQPTAANKARLKRYDIAR